MNLPVRLLSTAEENVGGLSGGRFVPMRIEFLLLALASALTALQSAGERLDAHGGHEVKALGEVDGARNGELNEQRRLPPHALGSRAELFDFPIHYLLACLSRASALEEIQRVQNPIESER